MSPTTAEPPDARAAASLALVVGPQQWSREQSYVRRRAVALLAEGCTPTLIVPESAAEPDLDAIVGDPLDRTLELPRTVHYPARVPFWLRRARLERLASRLERTPPDVIWAGRPESWPLARRLAEHFDRPLVLECRVHGDVVAAKRLIPDPQFAAVAVPCEALARAARGLLGESAVRLVPLAVPVAPLPRPPREEDRCRYVAILAGDAEPTELASALRAFASLCARAPGTMGGLELPARRSGAAWRLLGALDLRGILSSLEGSSMALRAVETADLLVVPERCGGPRIETLVGLGTGVPTVALADPYADALIEGETALLVPPRAGEEAWKRAIDEALTASVGAGIGERARELIASRHGTALGSAALAAVAAEVIRGPALRYSP